VTLNVPEEHLQPVLLIEVPRLLFPFARSIVANAVRDGGFPPLMVQPIDFLDLFRRRMAAAQAEQEAAGTA
jgi:preprotein translocase subunit SecB